MTFRMSTIKYQMDSSHRLKIDEFQPLATTSRLRTHGPAGSVRKRAVSTSLPRLILAPKNVGLFVGLLKSKLFLIIQFQWVDYIIWFRPGSVFRNHINCLIRENCRDASEAWRRGLHKTGLRKPSIRPLRPPNSPLILSPEIGICHFFRAEPRESWFALQQTGSHYCIGNPPVF